MQTVGETASASVLAAAVDASVVRPAGRYAAACALCAGNPIVFGGVLMGASEPPPSGVPPQPAEQWERTGAEGVRPKPLPDGQLSAQLWAADGAAGGAARGVRWERLVPSEDEYVGAPIARHSAAAVSLGGARMVVHGGITSLGEVSDELWMLACQPIATGAPDASWRLLRPNAHAEAPSARAHHTLVRTPHTNADGQAVLLYGGSAPPAGAIEADPTGRFFGDVWRLVAEVEGVLMRVRWVLLAKDGATAPVPRAAHAAAAHAHGACCEGAGCMIIFGGLDETHEPLGDLWEFCVSTRSWRELLSPAAERSGGKWAMTWQAAAASSTWPGVRHRHTLTALAAPTPANQSVGAAGDADSTPPSALLLFGGVGLPANRNSSLTGAAGASPLLDDGLWLFSLETATWMRIHLPAGGARPTARLGHVATRLTPSTLWLYGGLSSGEVAPAAQQDAPAWSFSLPSAAADEACVGCSANGACDLRLRRCVCEPPWSGERCESLQTAAVPAAPRRAISAALWLCGALLVGALLGWVGRHRALKREIEQRRREQARERGRTIHK